MLRDESTNMKRIIYKDENGVSPIMETFVAVGISVVLLAVFFTSANNLFTVYDTPNVDLQAKSIGIMETLLNSPGQDIAYNPSWESGYQNVSVLGLGTSQTIAYGIVNINKQGESTVISQYNFSNSSIGIATTCFLEGTKIVMADCLYKNIEDIKVGDMVKSFDEENGRLVNRRVTCVFHHAPEEMSDYYLVINDFLRVTPNHLMYSNGKWIHADDLEIDDSLFYPSSKYAVFSIERVYERVPTYDFEVGVDHCYFVAMDTSDVLVHNGDTTFPLNVDAHGPYDEDVGVLVQFNGEVTSGNGGYTYEWDFDDSDGIQVESNEEDPTHAYTQAGIYTATFHVEDSKGQTASDTATVNINPPPHTHADFTWFDNDGPYRTGTNISFDASTSSYSRGYIETYDWWWDWDPENPDPDNPDSTLQTPFCFNEYLNNETHYVRLRVTDNDNGNDACIHAVQANNLNPPDVDWQPWVLTSKDVYPNQTFVPYGKDHYIKYTPLLPLEDGYYLFEIKEKTTSTYNILDFEKIENITNVIYSVVKSALGIESESAICEFNITIVTTVNEIDVVTYTYGASHENTYALESATKEVLIYHKPTADNKELTNHPYYETGKITVCVFIGGIPPKQK